MVDPSGDLTRLERDVRLHKRLRDLLLSFSQAVSSDLGLPAALEGLTHEIRDLAAARSVEIWLHDRRNSQLYRAAASKRRTSPARVSIDDKGHYAASGLRLDRPKMRGPYLIAPLRGWRRALGTLVIERSTAPRRRGRPDADVDLVEFTRELSRQLSVGIENVQLLDDILRQGRLLEDTFNSLIDLVAVVDRELRIVQTNEAFAARVGVARDDLMRRPLAQLVGPETFAYVEAADTWQGIVPAVQRRVDDPLLDGTFLLTATPLTSQDGGQTLGRVLVARDITRQTRLEAERTALGERLAQSEKLASLGQFVAGIAHEMNNPLQGVLGHLELLIEMTEAARPVRRELRQIYQEADRAAKIVKNLLVFTGARRMTRKRVQVDRILTRVLASRETHLKRAEIKIVRRQGERLPPVFGDPLHLQQALLNILINAEHAVAGGETRVIEVSTSTRRPRKRVVITIRDTGTGISPDILPRIFDPFFTTKEVGRGTGLGLAITYGIVQDHGGTITADNARDGGAVFHLELPSAHESVGDRVSADSPAG
jgi:two-component system NtrC family sensor kinase